MLISLVICELFPNFVIWQDENPKTPFTNVHTSISAHTHTHTLSTRIFQSTFILISMRENDLIEMKMLDNHLSFKENYDCKIHVHFYGVRKINVNGKIHDGHFKPDRNITKDKLKTPKIVYSTNNAIKNEMRKNRYWIHFYYKNSHRNFLLWEMFCLSSSNEFGEKHGKGDAIEYSQHVFRWKQTPHTHTHKHLICNTFSKHRMINYCKNTAEHFLLFQNLYESSITNKHDEGKNWNCFDYICYERTVPNGM